MCKGFQHFTRFGESAKARRCTGGAARHSFISIWRWRSIAPRDRPNRCRLCSRISVGRAERLVELRLDEDTVAADAAAKPCGERLLIGKGAGVHRPKFGCEQLGVTAADAKDDQRAGIADHGRAYGVRELIGELVCQAKMVANFRASESKDANASELKVWNSSTWTKNGTRSRGGSAPRSIATSCKCDTSREPKKVRRLLPYRPFRQVRDQDAPVVHRESKVKARSDLAEDEPQVRRRGDLPDLVQDRRDRFRAERLRVAGNSSCQKRSVSGSVTRGDDALAKTVVGIEARKINKGGVLARDERRDAVIEEVLKPRPPAVGPEVFECRDDAGGGKRPTFGCDPGRRIKADGISVSPASR